MAAQLETAVPAAAAAQYGWRRGWKDLRRLPWRTIVIFLTPTLVLYFGFTIYPVFMTFYNSFHTLRMDLGMKTEFVGLANFIEILTEDKTFRLAVIHSLTWALVAPPLEMTQALLLSLVLYSRVPFMRFFRTAWFAPVLMSFPVVGVIWMWIYNYDWGLVNVILRAIGGEALTRAWLGNTTTALPALIVVTTWMFTGFNMVVVLAAMHALPEDLLDAARVDGANWFNSVRHIVIPLLRQTMVNLMILSFIGKMKQFAIVWVMTRGGPLWATETVATYVIKRAFDWKTLDLGYPSAIATIWFVVIFSLSLLLTRVLQRREVLEF